MAFPIIPRFPQHKCYIEVLAGGAALFFLRPPADVEVLNDIMAIWATCTALRSTTSRMFDRRFEWAPTSSQVFK